MDYIFAPISEKNCIDIQSLYETVFRKKVAKKMIREKYNTDYTGKSYFGYIAYYQNKPVAFFGSVPVVMHYNGKQEIAVQSVDSMVLKEHGGKGLFTKLANLTFEKLIQNDIKFIWGFANEASEERFTKSFDFSYKERLIGYTIITSVFPIEKAIQKISILKKIYSGYVKFIFEKYQTKEFAKGSIDSLDVVSVIRSNDYYHYKSQNGNFTIALFGVLFWIKIKNGLQIGDIEITENGDFAKAFEKLKKLAILCGIEEIQIQSSPDTLITQLLENIPNKKFISWSICYRNFSSEFPLENLKVTLGDLDTF